MNVTALVPVRAGSTRLKNKNISSFAGTNLLAYKIEQLKQVPLVTDIVVSSDSDLMLEIATAFGARTQKRPIEYCDETSKTFGEVVEWVCSNLDGEHILWATCTSPLTDSAAYQSALSRYFDILGEYDSLVSFEKFKHFLWDDNGPLNYSIGSNFVSSKELPNLYVKTCGISIAPRKKMIEWKFDHGTNPYKYILDKRSSIDIDDVYDLACARAWLDIEASA